MSACRHNFSWFIGLLAVGFGAETMLMVWHHPPFRSSFFFLLLATAWTVENRKFIAQIQVGKVGLTQFVEAPLFRYINFP